MAKCKSCEMLESIRQVDNRYREEGFSKKYKAKLVEEKYRGEDLIGRISHCSVDLNYCPECGKKLDD